MAFYRVGDGGPKFIGVGVRNGLAKAFTIIDGVTITLDVEASDTIDNDTDATGSGEQVFLRADSLGIAPGFGWRGLYHFLAHRLGGGTSPANRNPKQYQEIGLSKGSFVDAWGIKFNAEGLLEGSITTIPFCGPLQAPLGKIHRSIFLHARLRASFVLPPRLPDPAPQQKLVTVEGERNWPGEGQKRRTER